MTDKLFYFEHKNEVAFLWKTTINCIDTKIPRNSFCSSCKSSLIKESMIVKSDNKGYYRLYGLFCPKCRTLYVPENILDKLSEVCKYHFPNNIRNYTHPIQKKRESFISSLTKKELNNGIVMLIETDNGKRFTIVEKKDSTIPNSITLLYTEEFARELLAAALRPEKESIYKYKEYKGLIVHATPFSYYEDTLIITDKIVIRKGGGLHYKKRGGDSFVDLLFYSPYTKRYEIVCATYNKYDDEYFIDIIVWRRFVKNYGNPGFKPIFSTSVYDWDFSNLKESSILMDYGYSSTLPTKERREILTEMIDLDIVSVRKVLMYLQFFIDVPGAKINMYDSRRAWQSDWEYIKGYKVNPERFLISPHSL